MALTLTKRTQYKGGGASYSIAGIRASVYIGKQMFGEGGAPDTLVLDAANLATPNDQSADRAARKEEREAAKAKRQEERAAKKTEREQAREERKAKREAEKAERKAKRDAEREERRKAREDAEDPTPEPANA